VAWSDLNDLVGGLPRSAYDYSAFWKGDRSAWRGFTTENVRVGTSVTFVRRDRQPTIRAQQASQPIAVHDAHPDLVLIGCVKQKLPHPAPAKDLYASALFRKERAYAEASGAPWFVLSAEHGLVDPSTVLEPYDLRLSKTSREYRRGWGDRVADQIAQDCGDIDGLVIEIHAGAAYADAIRDRLTAAGASVREPLRGLTMGQRLAWYGAGTPSAPAERAPVPEVAELVNRLGSDGNATAPEAFLATNGAGTRHPGLYSWWVDSAGAADLRRGLGEPLQEGLIYAGLAGATRRRSGRRSSNTLWGRICGMHLGGRYQFSTFRLSLGSILASASDAYEIDEAALTAWMHEHLRLVTVVVDDADALDQLETNVLATLDPPLNLDKMPKTETRLRLSALRRQYGKRH